MALSAFVGFLLAKTSTGNKAFTGFGGQPKICHFVASVETSGSNVSGANLEPCFAAAKDSTHQFSVAGLALNTANGTSHTDFDAEKHAVELMNARGAVLYIADHVSNDSDGVTLNFTVSDGVARAFLVIALFGTDLSNVTVMSGSLPSTVTTKAFSGAGFAPTSAIFFYAARQTTETGGAGGSGNVTYCLGFASSTTNRAYNSMRITTAEAPTISRSRQITSKCLGSSDQTTGATEEADLQSFDADGLTLNVTTATTALFFYMVLYAGITTKMISFSSPTSTGSQSYTGTGAQPVAVLAASVAGATNASSFAHGRQSVGAATSSSARGVVTHSDQDATSSPNASHNVDSGQLIKHITQGGASPTTNSAMDLTSLDADGLTGNWGTADATQRENFVVAFMPAPASATLTPGAGSAALTGLAPSAVQGTVLTPGRSIT